MRSSKSASQILDASQGVREDSPLGRDAARWASAARPKTLLLAVTPVVTGTGLAVAQSGRLDAATALVTLIAAVAIQVGTNLRNDAADFERGTDTADRVGPPRASAQGWFTPQQVHTAAHLSFLTAFVFGIYLCWRGGWPILGLGLASLAAGYAYTSGPRPIAYGPFGEVFVLLFFGVAAVAGAYYLQTLSLSGPCLALGLALGLPASAVLLLNNYRDLETDRRAGRRTLCHYLGTHGSRILYALLLAAPFPIVLLADLPEGRWAVLAALPLGGLLIARLFRGAERGELNAMLGATALFQAALAALLLIGLELPPIA
jgi:1,4-dihydroxy-2-naphthoate polyprenyltransferase